MTTQEEARIARLKQNADEAIMLISATFEYGRQMPDGPAREMMSGILEMMLRTLPEEVLFSVVLVLIDERLSMKETIEVLSNPHIVADLEEAEKDIASGNLTPASELEDIMKGAADAAG